MCRTGTVTIAAALVTAALAAPGGAGAAGPLDDVARQLGCTSGRDGLRCTQSGGSGSRVVKSRVCLPGGGLDYRNCFKRSRRPPLPGP